MMTRRSAPHSKVWFAAALSGSLLFGTCADNGSDTDSDDCEAVEGYDEDDMVCCETYGLGAGGEKCCEEYEWIVAKDCPVSQTTGGGQRVVQDSCCDRF